MSIYRSIKLGVAGLLLSCGVQAIPINVGGVVWDPDQGLAFPNLSDFVANGTIFEGFAVNPGDIVEGRGAVTQLNSATPNQASFCPGCELTYTFSMELVSFVGVPNPAPVGGINGAFTFQNLILSFFVDSTPNFDGSTGTAADGNLYST